MEKKNNVTKKSNAKVVSSTSNSNNNIQPRVVLQRLSKDYTFGVATSSGNQPSTSGYLFRNKKKAEVDSSVSVKASGNNLTTRNKDRVIPSSSKPKNSVTNSQRKGVIEFRVAELKEANPYSSSDDTDSECSFYSSPEEVIILDENNSETEEDEWNVDEREKSRKNSYESNAPKKNNRRGLTRTESKIRKATKFLDLLIGTCGRRLESSTTDADEPSTSGQSQISRSITRSALPNPQRNTFKDCLVRVWLSICGQKRKKKFHVKLSQLIFLLHNKNHPLYKFRNSLSVRTLKFLTHSEIRAMARVLSDFVCAQPVTF